MLNSVSANWLFHPFISAARESASAHSQIPVRGEGKDAQKVPPDTARKMKVKSGIVVRNYSKVVK